MKTKLSDRYYTHEQARNKLGMTKARFQYWVRTGRIKRILPPNSKQGVYLKKEIDDIARELDAFLTAEETEGVQFMKATTDDIPEEYELAMFVFDGATHDIATRETWLAKNPEIDFVVRDQGRMVAFLTMLPVKHETIMRFMRGEIRGWEIPAEDVLPYAPDSTVECIIMSMATTPEAPQVKRKQYGQKLISGLSNFLQDLARRHVTITKFYATSVTPTGIAILRNAGFQEIGMLKSGTKKRIAFELDTMTSDSLIAKTYREALINTKVEEYRQELMAEPSKLFSTGEAEHLNSEAR